MTTYAPTPPFVERKSAPKTLTIIIAGHAALLATVITARMDLPAALDPTRTTVQLIPLPKEPPPQPPEPQPKQATQPRQSVIDKPQVIIPIPSPNDVPPVDDTPVIVPNPGPIIGPGKGPEIIDAKPLPKPLPVRTGPRFATPDSQLRPPYPANKIDSDEEASLRLRLSIDERGRVTAVDPVGSADPSFLAAARRHLIARWRYQAATEDGRPVPSSTVITLRFELD